MTKERRPCICRGWIEADPADLNAVAAAVQDHQATEQHAEARVVEQLQRPNVKVPSQADHAARRELEHNRRPIDVLLELRLQERRLATAGR